MFILHMLIMLHTHTPKSQHIHTHHAKHATHTLSMLIPHTNIMLLYMIEFIHAHIVAEKVT